jgi:two-component system, chemotaxis family, sensor kinase CheA
MAKDPYKYFRIETRDLLNGLTQGVLDLDKKGCTGDLIGHILRLAHTLKGAARIVKQTEIADLAHTLEGMFGPWREQQGRLPRELIDKALAQLDSITTQLSLLEPTREPAAKQAPASEREEVYETVRIEVEEVDALLHSVAETSIHLSALRQESEDVDRARQLAGVLLESVTQKRAIDAGLIGEQSKAIALVEQLCGRLEGIGRGLSARIDRIATGFGQVRDATNHLRLLPADSVFASLERAARDAAQSLHKEVSFESVGGNHRLDAHVLVSLRGALQHMVRNAVAHGIESPSERTAAGKPLPGRIALRVERRGDRLAFVCQDDGRGIDVDAVRRAAVQRGLVAPGSANSLGLEAAIQIIMQGGITTQGAVDEISGRGIGLDVVRETTKKLRGEVTVHSEFGVGTSIEICVPVSVSALGALEVEANGTAVFVPLHAVRQVLRVTEGDIMQSGGKASIVCEGAVIPFLALSAVLGAKAATPRKRQVWSAIVIEAMTGMAAIGVDGLFGARNIVVRPLSAMVQAEPAIAGAALGAEGDPQLVLDPLALVAAACRGGIPVQEAIAPQRSRVLVIDDSLTTRMLEQNILESAGYEVDIATSGEEALGKARGKPYGLFLCDVEMPGMNGFEFVSCTRSDPVLQKVPAILVTSRNDVADRRRGEEVGAHAYIVKGEFNQGYLLQRVRECIG